MTRIVLLITTILMSSSLAAQVTYRSYNSFGVVAGNSKSAYQVFTTHGVRYQSWYGGLGIGIDDYRNRTVPVIASVLREVLPKNNMFINVNAGTQFLWGDNAKNRMVNAIDYKALPGFFGEVGLGYRLAVGNEGQGVTFGTYYSYKSFKEKFIVPGICNNPPCENATEYIESKFSRWAFKLGFVF